MANTDGAQRGWHTVPVEKTTKCKRCGATRVAWAQSKRTGKWYLCNTAPVGSFSRFAESRNCDTVWVMPNFPHNCDDWRKQTALLEGE